MNFIRAIDSFLRAYNPKRLLRDFLRNSPAYTGADHLTPTQEVKQRQAEYSDEIYENRQPSFTEGEQLYREDNMDIPQSDSHMVPLHQSFPTSGDISGDIPMEQEPMSDADIIEIAIDEVKDGLIPIDFDDDPYAEPFDAAFDEPFADTGAIDDDPYAEPFDAPFDEPFEPSYGTPGMTLDDMVEEAYEDAADMQDDVYDDPYADPSLEDMVDEPMEDPQDMPEPEPMDPMDDPMNPYMPYGGFPFPPGG